MSEQKETPTTRLLAGRKPKLESDGKYQLNIKAQRIKRVELADYLRMVAEVVEESNRERFNVTFSITDVREEGSKC